MKREYEQWEAKVLEAVDRLIKEKREGQILIAIDGKSGSGKSTLAKRVQEVFGGNLFHMDDFFLRPEQRTEERLSEIGGNVDYERFKKVLEQISSGEEICYRRYDCKKQELEPAAWMLPQRLNVVEGAYSMHPYFGDCYQLKISLDIAQEEQRKRILYRNGPRMAAGFEKEWIPKENAYLKKFKIFENSDWVIKVEDGWSPEA